jgi:hypothetical protein
MNAAVIWIIFPGLLGLIALVGRKIGPSINLILAGFSLILAWIAWQFPIDQAFDVASTALKINSSFSILGRSLTIADIQRPLIVFVFVANAMWLFGAYLSLPGSLFPGISQIGIAFFVAAISVQPFLYAAIFIAFIVLVSIPLLSDPGQDLGDGLPRFLIFQLLGVPFILFVGWILAGVEASPGNSELVIRAGIGLILGFSFLLALFPFHSWLPKLAQQSHPYSFAFLAFFLPFASLLLALTFFERFAWIRDFQNLDQSLILLGGIVSAIGALFALVQQDIRRQAGYLIVFQTGIWIAAIGLYVHAGLLIFFTLAWVHLIAMIIWSTSVSGLRLANHGDTNIHALSRISLRHPILLLSYFLSLAAFAGLPFSLSFFPRILFISNVGLYSESALAPILLGQFFVILLFIRNFHILLAPFLDKKRGKGEESLLGPVEDPLELDSENPLALIYLGFLITLIVIFGFFPALALKGVSALITVFPLVGQ